MKKIIFALAIFAATYSQIQAQTFSPAEATSVEMQLPKNVTIAPIEVVKGESIEIVVEIANEMSAETFERIKRTSRYEVVGVKKANSYVITMPNLEKKMKVNGKEVREEIVLRVKANENYKLGKKNSIVLAGKDKKATFKNDITVELRLAESTAAMGVGPTTDSAEKATKKSTTTNKASNKGTIKPSGKYGDILIDDVPIDPF
jgi:hypothetical protein